MAIFEEVLQAEYKGIQFLVTDTDTPGGIKHVKHLFPNSSNQIIEELGRLQRTYNLTAIITGEDYTERRNRLLEALEAGGIGILVHPFEGTIDNVKAVSWTPVENFSRLGELRIAITFEVDTGQAVPVPTENTVSIVAQDNTNVINAINSNVSNNYSITSSFTQNFVDAFAQANDIVDAFNENTQIFAVAADQIDIFSSEISAFGNNVSSLIRSPQRLIDSISNLFSTVNGLYPTVTSTASVLKRFFTFGDNDAEILTTTASRIERKRNRDLLRSTIQTQSLTYAYLNTSQINFTSIVELTAEEEELETQYQKVIAAPGISEEVKDNLSTMRVDVQQFFREQRLTINQIVSINTPTISSRLLAYQYYGSTENATIIEDLNNLTDVSFISGDLDIITT